MPLYQIDPKTNDIKREWESLEIACSTLQVNIDSVRKAIRGIQATSYGFKWSFKRPQWQSKARDALYDIKAAKELAKSCGGHYRDYLNDISS